MEKIQLIAPCHFGLEAVLKREIYDLGYDTVKVEDGKITFEGDVEAVCRSNIFLRTAERILWKVGEFHADSFDELFENIKALPWEELIPENGKFWVKKAVSVKSALFSPTDIQSIVKKAIVERLKGVYSKEWFEETGVSYPIRISILKDMVTVGLDTSGDSLHKRGYRPNAGVAPISETLAAALIMLTPWKKDRILVDPFCGSGTIPIEAAMIACKIAPGRNRTFTAQAWDNIISKQQWADVFEEAENIEEGGEELDIQGYDIDGKVLKLARENAKLAGVDGKIHFQERSVSKLSHPKKYGFLITNPPYGERLEDKELLPELYKSLGNSFAGMEDWSAYIITSYEQVEKDMGRKANKNRKLYNGMIRTYYYQFQGSKPPVRKNRGVNCEE